MSDPNVIEVLASMRSTARERESAREEQARSNRARFPFAAEWLDAVNAHFPGSRILYAKNFVTGDSIGRRPQL